MQIDSCALLYKLEQFALLATLSRRSLCEVGGARFTWYYCYKL